MPNRWTITSAGGGRDTTILVGAKILLSVDENSYYFSAPSGTVLQITTGTLPTPPFDFPSFLWSPPGLGVLTWWIHVSTLTGGPARNQAQGTWRSNDPQAAQDESGTFTAQAGATLEEELEGDAAAASAGGGSSV